MDSMYLCLTLDFSKKNDIIISLIVTGGAALSNRTKQVQFRMPEELHTELKAALAYDKSSFVDLFNKAAESYLSKRKRDEQRQSKGENGGN